ncbi:MAG: type II secretion system protein GspM, partial [Pseudomonadota bacterium]
MMKLRRREKMIIGLGVLVLLGLAVYFAVVEPVIQRRDSLKKLTLRMETDLREMRNLAARYKALAESKNQLERQVSTRGKGFAPFAYLENLARESGLTGQIESMTPVAAKVEEGQAQMAEFDLRLSGIGLPQLVNFLYRLESSDKVFFVVNLNIRPRYLTPDLLDVTLR